MSSHAGPDRISVVIPAHNEAAVIPRLLDALMAEELLREATLDIWVVCNGCTDNTAALVRERYPAVHVIETAVASKGHALDLGDGAAQTFPRLYIDADVVIDVGSVNRLAASLRGPGVKAAAPTRQLELAGASLWVRRYYAVWEQLPATREGLFGRGVVGVNESGHARLVPRDQVQGDDLAAHHAFTASERAIVPDAVSRIWTPTHTRDLVTRRTRAALGNAEFPRVTGREGTSTTSASAGSVLLLALRRPRLMPSIVVFLGITLWARKSSVALRSEPNAPWLRDESSRVAAQR